MIEIPTANAERVARVDKIENQVDAREARDIEMAPAYDGQRLAASGQVQTHAASRAQVLFTEGTLIRLGENTLFSVEGMNNEITNPATRLFLTVGKIWIVLVGGEQEAPIFTPTASGTPTRTSTPPMTDQPTRTPTDTSTPTPVNTPTWTHTPTQTYTPTPTFTGTPTTPMSSTPTGIAQQMLRLPTGMPASSPTIA